MQDGSSYSYSQHIHKDETTRQLLLNVIKYRTQVTTIAIDFVFLQVGCQYEHWARRKIYSIRKQKVFVPWVSDGATTSAARTLCQSVHYTKQIFHYDSRNEDLI